MTGHQASRDSIPGPGLAPVIGDNPEILILGSYPSVQSIAKGEYYGNPQNRFWTVLEACRGIPCELPYAARISRLREQRIALWDVVRSCIREGSLDTAIRHPFMNDIGGLLAAHPTIRAIAFNGTAAGHYYSALRIPAAGDHTIIVLPSTSPANARIPLAEKIRRWDAALNSPHQ